jgi:hypothetical protein
MPRGGKLVERLYAPAVPSCARCPSLGVHHHCRQRGSLALVQSLVGRSSTKISLRSSVSFSAIAHLSSLCDG